MLIVFEGIDAAGKTTMCNLLSDYLRGKGLRVAVYRYPNKSSIYGSIIRLFLESKISLSVEEQFLLYILDMVREKRSVLEASNQGCIVLIDRYYTSTIAYQCSQGFSYEAAKKVIEILSLPKPDAVIYLDIDPKTAVERKKRQKKELDVFERNTELLEAIRRMYMREAEEGYPTKNWIVIDATKSIEEVYKEVVEATKTLMESFHCRPTSTD